MTQEEKARAYDKAIEKIKYVMEHGVSPTLNKEDLQDIFPELKESEDERIRKHLIKHFGNKSKEEWNGVLVKDILTWLEKQGDANKEYWRGYREGKQEILDKYAELEKQGEQKPTLPKWKYKKDNTPLLRDSLILNKYGCVAKSPSGAIVSDVWVLDYDELAKLPKEEIEKQGEQKPNKVEPKFHEGEWITNGNYTWKIVEVKPLDYILQSQDGNIVDDTISHVDEQFHSFTIEDAKDGDVLFYRGNVNYSDGIKFDRILLFENLDKSFFVLTKYSNGVEDYGIDVNIDYPNNIVLATKEQKEILFMAMADEGYTFDFEKKELRKIKHNSAWSENDEYIIEKLFCLLDNEQDNYPQLSCDFQEIQEIKDWLKSLKDRVGCEANFTTTKEWSEEDDIILSRIIADYERSNKEWFNAQNSLPHGKKITWLKSLKDRVQLKPKQEWNEEDEDILNTIINHFEIDLECTENDDIIKWLKSLKPQNKWKPSDEQMKVLKELVEDNNQRYFYTLLKSLYEQLKILKER